MRYDSENRIIKISLCEFVSIARRGISSSVSFDEDEPSISPIAASRLSRLVGVFASASCPNHQLSPVFLVFRRYCEKPS